MVVQEDWIFFSFNPYIHGNYFRICLLQLGDYGVGGTYLPHVDQMNGRGEIIDYQGGGERVATLINMIHAPIEGIEIL